MITGNTRLIAHLGFPTEVFASPHIYNPWFESRGIDAAVIPLGLRPEDFGAAFRGVLGMSNVVGALIAMPYKVAVAGLVDEATEAVRIAGACNAVIRRPDGSLFGDLFDGEGFARALERRGFAFTGAACTVLGAGGVGSAIAAALAGREIATLRIADVRPEKAEALVNRIAALNPAVAVRHGSASVGGYDLVVNATPLGSGAGDPLPFDAGELSAGQFVGDVALVRGDSPLLALAKERGCEVQPGIDMLFEQIPLYLELFGFGKPSVDELRAAARLE